jgi:GntR family transcriptional regulator, transcriptional repressor for pyruvate dehydrogenase complex
MATRFKSVVPSAPLSDRVALAIGDRIRTGLLAAGDRLPTELMLVEQFGVSRTVVREAVSRLKSLGLVDSRQGSGVFVKPAGFSPLNFDANSSVSKQAVIQINEVRRSLEAEVAALAAERRNKTELLRIQRAAAAIDKAVGAGGDGVSEDIALHCAVAEAAQNPFLISTLEYLRQYLRGAIRVTRANEAQHRDFARQVRNEHMAIVAAIEQGDSKKARVAATDHVSNAIARIEKADPVFWAQIANS